jgi:hypothetical protein
MGKSSALLLRLGILAALLLVIAGSAYALIYTQAFGSLRRAWAEHLLGNALGLDATIGGPIDIGFGLYPDITIADISADRSDLANEVKSVSARTLEFRVSLLGLLLGSAAVDKLAVDGLKVDIDVPPEAKSGEGAAGDGSDLSGFIHKFVRQRFTDDLDLKDFALDYVNRETGFAMRYDFARLGTIRAASGEVVVGGEGRINGEALTLQGKVTHSRENAAVSSFAITTQHAGLGATLSGTYTLADPVDTMDATLRGDSAKLSQLFAVYAIRSDFDGAADFTAKLAGRLDALKLDGLALNLIFENGDKFELSGGVADLVQGTGIDLSMSGTLLRPPKSGEQPVYDLGITGFSGRISGSIDGVLVRDLHVATNSVKAALKDIGPITAERVFKDAEGRIGLYDILVLAGDRSRPSVRVAGTIKDVLELQGIDLKGMVDFQTADFLDLAAERNAAKLGHLKGTIAVSDADGSLGIEEFSAQVTDSALIGLKIRLIFDDLRHQTELDFATDLDIPNFKSFAAALGSSVADLGPVKFRGTVSGSAAKIGATGTTLVGQTTITGTLTGSFNQGRPVLAGSIATRLLHLADLLRLSSIRAVYLENVDEADADVFDYSKVWEALLVDLEVKVAEIVGGGGASNLSGRVTYQAGLVGLDPLTLTFLGGKVATNGKIDTRGKQESFALKGNIANLRIGEVLKEFGSNYAVGGALHVDYDLTGTGNTRTAILKSLGGGLNVALRHGWIGTTLLDLTGISLPEWLLTRSPDGDENIACLVAPFSFHQGRGVTHGLVLETSEVQVVGVGFVDFRQSEINLQFKPKALHEQFLKIAQPFAIEGPLSKPELRLTGHPVAGAATEILAFPFNLLEAIVQPEATDPNRVPCRVIVSAKEGQVPAGGPGVLAPLFGNPFH